MAWSANLAIGTRTLLVGNLPITCRVNYGLFGPCGYQNPDQAKDELGRYWSGCQAINLIVSLPLSFLPPACSSRLGFLARGQPLRLRRAAARGEGPDAQHRTLNQDSHEE